MEKMVKYITVEKMKQIKINQREKKLKCRCLKPGSQN